MPSGWHPASLRHSIYADARCIDLYQIVEASSVTSSNGNGGGGGGGGGGVVEVPAAGATMKSNGFATLELVKVHDLYKPSSGFSLKSMGGYLGGDYVQGRSKVKGSPSRLPAENLLEDIDGCCSLLLLTCALLMTSSHSKATKRWNELSPLGFQ